jgi:ketosteroid isomerase-like protein
MTTPSETQDPKAIVMQAWQAFASRDPARIAALFHQDADWIAPHGNATAVALGYTSGMPDRASIVRFITEEFGRLFVDDVQSEFTSLFADGGTVIVEQRLQARLVNDRRYDNRYCFVFVVEDGRIRQVREYMDTLGGRDMVFGVGEPARKLVA